jgi:4'-phosphopantetheinyl transferase
MQMKPVARLYLSGAGCGMSMECATVYFLVQKLTEIPEPAHWLNACEIAKREAFRFAKRRNDWTLGRWTAKRALQCYFALTGGAAIDFSELEICTAHDGAPEAELFGKPAPISLALSHSGNEGFCVVGPYGCALGCDQEMVQPREESLARDYFCAEERARVFAAPIPDRSFLMTLIWSAKESALKCLRAGLRRDTRSVLVRFRGSGRMRWHPFTVRCRETSSMFYGWWRDCGGSVQTVAAGRPLRIPVELAGPEPSGLEAHRCGPGGMRRATIS